MFEMVYIYAATAIFVLNMLIKMWRHSVSTMLFSAAALWCATTAQADGVTEDVRWAGVLVILVAAEVRAVMKSADDRVIPHA